MASHPKVLFSLKDRNRFFRKEILRGGFGYVVPCAQNVPPKLPPWTGGS
jgi:hypothetical protein